MRTIIASSALALLIAQHASAQTEPPADNGAMTEPQGQTTAEESSLEAEPEANVGGAVGLATGSVGETFFIRMPQEYHLLTSDLPGQPVYFDTTSTGMQRPSASAPEAEGTVPAEIRDGTDPLGQITDVLLDRRGGSAGLVIQLDESMRGGAREIAVAMGLVRMLPSQDDAGQTHILLSLDPVDLENAPNFARAGAGAEDAAGAQPQDNGEAPEQETQVEADPATSLDQSGGAEVQQ